jgi:hypothetical protein
VEDHSRRLEQVEDRISELEDKWKLKENWRYVSQTTQDLKKEYVRIHQLH